MRAYTLKVGSGYWWISVSAERRQAVIAALKEHACVLSAEAYCAIGEKDGEKIKVQVSDRIEPSDRIEILDICE